MGFPYTFPFYFADYLLPVSIPSAEAFGIPTILVVKHPSKKMAYDGYRLFVSQYVENSIAGKAPLKLPDGTVW